MNKQKIYKVIFFLFFLIHSFFIVIPISASKSKGIELPVEQQNEIDKLVNKYQKAGKMPGVYISIMQNGDILYEQGYGYADKENKKEITNETLFEIGSTSKAFTGLAILKLQKEGKINLDEPITKYIPWLKILYSGTYKGKKIKTYPDIKIKEFLYQTSGIPFHSIDNIPISNQENALEETVKTLFDLKLNHYPGSKFEYATMNYDVLGLLIEYVTKMPYERYIETEILKALGLNNTYLSREGIEANKLAKEYKINFLKARKYEAPVFKGNVPAGYIISCAKDLSKWLNIQMGVFNTPESFRDIIKESHIPDRSVPPSYTSSSYAAGWEVYQDGNGKIAHGGNNPTYSSYLLFRPKEQLGIVVLCNLNTSYIDYIGNGILSILEGDTLKSASPDMYLIIDKISVILITVLILLILITCVFLFKLLYDIQKKKRIFNSNRKKIIFYCISCILILVLVSACLYFLPYIMFDKLSWGFVNVWGPNSILIVVKLFLFTVILFMIYFILENLYTTRKESLIFIAGILGVIGGFGETLLILMVNMAVARAGKFQWGLFLYFIFGMSIYIFGQRLIRKIVIKQTNILVYTKRIKLISLLIDMSFDKFELLEDGSIESTLNSDMETISNNASLFVTALTSAITLICCFFYLAIMNIYGFIASLIVLCLGAVLYFKVSENANILWENTRTIQNVFFEQIGSLKLGFKELKMNKQRGNRFSNEIKESCEEYKDMRIQGENGFIGAFLAGELLFTSVIGIVAFFFPVFLKNVQTTVLVSYIFVFLYMTGPVNGILNSIPRLLNLKIAYGRYKKLLAEVQKNEYLEENRNALITTSAGGNDRKEHILELKNIEYSYHNYDNRSFKIDNISTYFKTGEIVFITGGNGSGKSTFGKVLVGLYPPDKGDITLDRRSIKDSQLRENFSTVFSDFYLFKKLYGMDWKDKESDIKDYLKILQLENKISIENGEFTTTKLSSGQRKRIALLISFIEDRHFYMFDEWASDQDPEFKDFFYHTLLIKLKNAGKGVIVISHDDRYFNVADRVIKLESGSIA